jgi:hypothetical protein
MRSALRRIATLQVRHAASNRFVMFGAMALGFDPLLSRFEPRSLVFSSQLLLGDR